MPIFIETGIYIGTGITLGEWDSLVTDDGFEFVTDAGDYLILDY
jgi:hypothetical protein